MSRFPLPEDEHADKVAELERQAFTDAEQVSDGLWLVTCGPGEDPKQKLIEHLAATIRGKVAEIERLREDRDSWHSRAMTLINRETADDQ